MSDSSRSYAFRQSQKEGKTSASELALSWIDLVSKAYLHPMLDTNLRGMILTNKTTLFPLIIKTVVYLYIMLGLKEQSLFGGHGIMILSPSKATYSNLYWSLYVHLVSGCT